MLNHLPAAAKQRVKREYWMRVATVMLVLVGSSVLGVAILHTPAYVAVNNQLEQYQDSFSAAAARTEDLQAAEATVIETNQLTTRVLENASTTPLRQYYRAILSQVSDQVTVTAFSIRREEESGTPGNISLSGVAVTREALANFQRALEQDEHFASAELPISSLASSRDISFSMTLTPVVKQP